MNTSAEKQTNEEGSPLLQHLIGPIVVGVVILLGQSVLQPWISERTQTRTERVNAKARIYSKALDVVNREFGALEWKDPDGTTRPARPSIAPTSEEVNSAYAELLLYSNDRQIISAFIRSLGFGPNQSGILQQDRIDLINSMRKDLGFPPIDLREEDVKLFDFSTSKLKTKND